MLYKQTKHKTHHINVNPGAGTYEMPSYLHPRKDFNKANSSSFHLPIAVHKGHMMMSKSAAPPPNLYKVEIFSVCISSQAIYFLMKSFIGERLCYHQEFLCCSWSSIQVYIKKRACPGRKYQNTIPKYNILQHDMFNWSSVIKSLWSYGHPFISGTSIGNSSATQG